MDLPILFMGSYNGITLTQRINALQVFTDLYMESKGLTFGKRRARNLAIVIPVGCFATQFLFSLFIKIYIEMAGCSAKAYRD